MKPIFLSLYCGCWIPQLIPELRQMNELTHWCDATHSFWQGTMLCRWNYKEIREGGYKGKKEVGLQQTFSVTFHLLVTNGVEIHNINSTICSILVWVVVFFSFSLPPFLYLCLQYFCKFLCFHLLTDPLCSATCFVSWCLILFFATQESHWLSPVLWQCFKHSFVNKQFNWVLCFWVQA